VVHVIQRHWIFGKQVDGAAWQFQQYFKKPENWHFQVGQTYEIDGFFITPMTQATANLYHYTPHHSGNKHFLADLAGILGTRLS